MDGDMDEHLRHSLNHVVGRVILEAKVLYA